MSIATLERRLRQVERQPSARAARPGGPTVYLPDKDGTTGYAAQGYSLPYTLTSGVVIYDPKRRAADAYTRA